MSPEHDSKDEGTGFETSAELRHGDTFPPMRDYRPPPAPAPSRVLWVAPFVCLGSTRDGSSCSARSASCVRPRLAQQVQDRLLSISTQSPFGGSAVVLGRARGIPTGFAPRPRSRSGFPELGSVEGNCWKPGAAAARSRLAPWRSPMPSSPRSAARALPSCTPFAFLGLGLAAVHLGLLVARRSNAAALVLYFLGAAGVAGLVVAHCHPSG